MFFLIKRNYIPIHLYVIELKKTNSNFIEIFQKIKNIFVVVVQLYACIMSASLNKIFKIYEEHKK